MVNSYKFKIHVVALLLCTHQKPKLPSFSLCNFLSLVQKLFANFFVVQENQKNLFSLSDHSSSNSKENPIFPVFPLGWYPKQQLSSFFIFLNCRKSLLSLSLFGVYNQKNRRSLFLSVVLLAKNSFHIKTRRKRNKEEKEST
jgi:hypothetical protein